MSALLAALAAAAGGQAAVLGAVLLRLPAAAPGSRRTPPRHGRRRPSVDAGTERPSSHLRGAAGHPRQGPARRAVRLPASRAPPSEGAALRAAHPPRPRRLRARSSRARPAPGRQDRSRPPPSAARCRAVRAGQRTCCRRSPSTWWTPGWRRRRASRPGHRGEGAALLRGRGPAGRGALRTSSPPRTCRSAAGGSSGGSPARSRPRGRWPGALVRFFRARPRRPAAAPPLLPLDVRTRRRWTRSGGGPARRGAAAASSTSGCSEIVRGYLGERYGFDALECTSAELLARCAGGPTPGLPQDALALRLRVGPGEVRQAREAAARACSVRWSLRLRARWCRPPPRPRLRPGRARCRSASRSDNPGGALAPAARAAAGRGCGRSGRERAARGAALLRPRTCFAAGRRGAARRTCCRSLPLLARAGRAGAGGGGPRPAADGATRGCGTSRWRASTSSIALDLSTSMEAGDFRPQNRLYVAKEVLSEFIASRVNDRIGLVVFAGAAYTQAPLTLDYGVLKEVVQAAAHPGARGRHGHRRRARRRPSTACATPTPRAGWWCSSPTATTTPGRSLRSTPRRWRKALQHPGLHHPGGQGRQGALPRRARTCSATPPGARSEIPINPELLQDIAEQHRRRVLPRHRPRVAPARACRRCSTRWSARKLIEGGASANYREEFHPFLLGGLRARRAGAAPALHVPAGVPVTAPAPGASPCSATRSGSRSRRRWLLLGPPRPGAVARCGVSPRSRRRARLARCSRRAAWRTASRPACRARGRRLQARPLRRWRCCSSALALAPAPVRQPRAS